MDQVCGGVEMGTESYLVSDDKKYSGIRQSAEDTKHWPVGVKINTEGLSVLGDLFLHLFFFHTLIPQESTMAFVVSGLCRQP